MYWPSALIVCGVTFAAWLAFGTDPAVARHVGGLKFIMLSRQLQWLLILGAVLPCVWLIVRVALEKNRAWWLLSLALVAGLFLHKFRPVDKWPVRVLDAAALPTAAQATLETADEWVVGFEFAGNAYALPYRCLLRTPIVYLTDFDRRLLVIWSPFANLATATEVSYEVRPSDLEVVAMPDNSTLVHNRKYGQFIIGVTGVTPAGKSPTGALQNIPTTRTTWAAWQTRHPETRLLEPVAADLPRPGVPLAPRYPLTGPAAHEPVALLHAAPPVALATLPARGKTRNFRVGDLRLLVFRDDAGVVNVFDRAVPTDLWPTFELIRKGNSVTLRDADTESVWTMQGRCVEGPLKGEKLRRIAIDEGVLWGVIQTHWPDARRVEAE